MRRPACASALTMTMSSFMAKLLPGSGLRYSAGWRAAASGSLTYVIRTCAGRRQGRLHRCACRLCRNCRDGVCRGVPQNGSRAAAKPPILTANAAAVGSTMTDTATTDDQNRRAGHIKKYANRRLYNTGTSTYVTLEDLAAMVKTGEDFVVYDAKTGEDITRSVLTQIIFEQENKEGQNLLPIAFLRQLIRFYGDSMQMLVPRYLEVSIESLTREQEKFRHQMAQAFGVGAVRRARGSGAAEHGNVRARLRHVRAVRAARRPGRDAAQSRKNRRQERRRDRRPQAPARRDAEEVDKLGREGRRQIERRLTDCHDRLRRAGDPRPLGRWRARPARPADNRSPSPAASSPPSSSCTHSATVARFEPPGEIDQRAHEGAVVVGAHRCRCTKAPSILTMSTPSLRRLRNEV